MVMPEAPLLKESVGVNTDSLLIASLIAIMQKLDALVSLPAQVDKIKQSIHLMLQKYDEILNKQVQHNKDINFLKKLACKFKSRVAVVHEVQQLKAS